MDRDAINALSNVVLSCAFEVHTGLGPGLLESAYEACMCHELATRGVAFQRQVVLGLGYKGMELDVGYRIDILVEGVLVLEIKAVEKVLPVHKAQALTYLMLSKNWLALLVNFNEVRLKDGIHRVVFGDPLS